MSRDILFDICYFVVFPTAPAIALLGIKLAGISLKKFSLPSLIVIFYIVTAYLGLLPIYMGWDRVSADLGAVDPTLIYWLTAYAGMALITMVGGLVCARQVFGRAQREVYGIPSQSNARQLLVMCFLFFISFAGLGLYLVKVPSVALVHVVDGDLLGAAVARSEMTNNFSGDYWRYEILFRHMLDFCVLYTFIEWRVRRSKSLALAFLILFFMAAFSATMSIEKGPLLMLLVMLYLTHVSMLDGRYYQRTTMRFIPGLVLLIAVLKMKFMGSTSLSEALGDSAWRVLTGQITPAYFYLEQFPSHTPYLLGTSFPNPGGILPFEAVSVSVKVAEIMYPNDVVRGIVGSAPTVYWAEMYANFGPYGVIVSSFLVGVGIYVVHFFIRRLAISAASIAVTVFLAMHYAQLTATGLSEFVFDIPVAAIVSAAAGLIVVRRLRVAKSS